MDGCFFIHHYQSLQDETLILSLFHTLYSQADVYASVNFEATTTFALSIQDFRPVELAFLGARHSPCTTTSEVTENL